MPVRSQWFVTPALRLCNDGEVEKEGSAASQLTFRFDAAAVRLDEVLHDGKAQSRAALLPRAARVNAIEPLENARQMVGGDAAAGVGDTDEDTATIFPGEGALGNDANAALRLGVAQRVIKQVREDLPQRVRIDGRGRGGIFHRRLEADLAVGGTGRKGIPGFPRRRLDISVLWLRPPTT